MSDTEADLAGLRRVAEAATPAGIEAADSDGRAEWRRFWAAATPAAVLGLLDRLEAAEAKVQRVETLAVVTCPGCFEPGHLCGDPVCNLRADLRAALADPGDERGQR